MGAIAGCVPVRERESRAATPVAPVIDFHVHLFGVSDGGTGCFLSPKQKQHITCPFFLRLLRLSENGRLDEDYLQRIVDQLRDSSVNKAVLVAQDSRYDHAGNPDFENTSLFVPNDYLFHVVSRFPRAVRSLHLNQPEKTGCDRRVGAMG